MEQPEEHTIEQLAVPQGIFTLGRPAAGKTPLRAWDAADEYLLSYLDQLTVADGASVVVVNDSYGALATAAAHLAPTSLGDSVVAKQVLESNLGRNGFDPSAVTFVPSLGELPERIDVVLIKVPKTVALLEHQLHQLRPHLHSGSVVVGAGMTRHVHNSTIELFASIIGTTTTSLAVKKARLIHAEVATTTPTSNPWPETLDFRGHSITSHAGVFSSGRVDQGTQMLVDVIDGLDAVPTDLTEDEAPRGLEPDVVVDLGCGSGVLGLAYALSNPDAHMHFTDVSYLAIESARATWLQAFGDDREATFEVADRLESVSDVALILNNPPFHEQHARGDEIAWRMFGDSYRALRPGGAILVVGNRHLGYHAKLKRRFRNCETVASNNKFVVLRSDR